MSLLLLAVAGLACGDAAVAPSSPPACVPDEASYEATLRPLLAQRCFGCHGDAPQFGAPFPLTEYAPLIEGPEGERIVDRMAFRIAEGSMPPVGAPQPELAERDTIVRWASCGNLGVEAPTGPSASRPPFMAPAEPPAGLTTVDVTAGGFVVDAADRDRYQDFFFSGVVDEERFIRRFEAVVDDARVVHHLTLERAQPGGAMRYLYTWAPGTGAFEFPEGGIRLGPDDELRLEIHYNNGASLPDVVDSSGVRLFLGEVAGTEYLMADPGPGAFGFSVPARSESTAETDCTVQQDVTVLATMPHMHEIGTSFEVLVDGEEVLRLDGWSFENQLFYDLPLALRAGQRLTVRCDFRNATSDAVRAGLRTEDEMCFAFTYITPAFEDFCE
ncbi:MAG: hypothetical protein AAF447_20100 [Myxococcota bacterium]